MGPSANVERYRENFMVAVADVFDMENKRFDFCDILSSSKMVVRKQGMIKL